jgi:uncharacterized membrane protein
MKAIPPELFTQMLIALIGLGGLVTIGLIVVAKLRGDAQRTEDTSGQMLSNLQELHREGDISDAEYRTIKAVLGGKLQSRVKDDHPKA